jgi:hypothetical protein
MQINDFYYDVVALLINYFMNLYRIGANKEPALACEIPYVLKPSSSDAASPYKKLKIKE